MKRFTFSALVCLLGGILLLLLSYSVTDARNVRKETIVLKPTAPMQDFERRQRVHRVGNVYFCVSNWGFFGSATRDYYESLGGCFNPRPDDEYQPAPSFEMPPGSELEYLFWGGLWIGAIVESLGVVETLVTVGCDGWFWIHEFAPPPGEAGYIREMSTRPSASCYNDSAVSEQDIISVIQDTADAPLTFQQMDPWDNRKHRPLGIEILQKSYSWSYAYASDFIMLDYVIKNINPVKTINNMWIALYIDADVGHMDENPYALEQGAQDDIAGFLKTYTTPKGVLDVQSAWIADNDGQPDQGVFTAKSATGVSGVRVIKAPEDVGTYFNWYISNAEGHPNDWGPWRESSMVKWKEIKAYGGLDRFPAKVLGTPGGDISKYFIMSNIEWDYDQIYAGQDYTAEGWLPPSPKGIDLADGFDTRYVFSFGPFPTFGPGDSIMFTIAYIGGEDLHVDPNNRSNLPGNPDKYMENLHFEDFATNSLWAKWIYERGFKGPPPPDPPELEFEADVGRVKIKWNGRVSEESIDDFTDVKDFEGYNIYMSTTKSVQEFMLLGSFDREDNYQIYKKNLLKEDHPWEWIEGSITLDSLQSVCDTPFVGNDPPVWTLNNPYAYQGHDSLFFVGAWYSIYEYDTTEAGIDSFKVDKRDTLYIIAPDDTLYFTEQSYNLGFDDIIVYPEYRDSVDVLVDSLAEEGYDRDSVFQAILDRDVYNDTLSLYYAYEFEATDLLPSQVYYFAVTTFDFGYPFIDVEPLESGILVNATLVYPLESAKEVVEKGLDVVVAPNPWKISETENYIRMGWQDGDGPFDERITFFNLPAKCTIRIYTLDGDLVKEIIHDKDESDGGATVESWNMVSKNTQKIVSGIYLFSVESADGRMQVDKFVVIR